MLGWLKNKYEFYMYVQSNKYTLVLSSELKKNRTVTFVCVSFPRSSLVINRMLIDLDI